MTFLINPVSPYRVYFFRLSNIISPFSIFFCVSLDSLSYNMRIFTLKQTQIYEKVYTLVYSYFYGGNGVL